MSNDLVKRLRELTCNCYDAEVIEAAKDAMDEAADRIEKLESGEEEWNRICNSYAARIDKLEAALAHIYAWYPISVASPMQTVHEIRDFARKALEGKDD